MTKLNTFTRFACFGALCVASATSSAQSAPPRQPAKATATTAVTATTPAVKSGHMAVNGVNYYYEVRGRGEPLLLLHGGLGTLDMFGPVLTRLAESRLVIAVDLQGHGRTPLGSRAFRLESMGDDMAVLTRRLGHTQLDVMGYSLGAGVALRMALQQPAAVRRLVLVSACFSDDGFYPELRALQGGVSGKVAPMMKDTPMYKSYAAVAPNVASFRGCSTCSANT